MIKLLNDSDYWQVIKRKDLKFIGNCKKKKRKRKRKTKTNEREFMVYFFLKEILD